MRVKVYNKNGFVGEKELLREEITGYFVFSDGYTSLSNLNIIDIYEEKEILVPHDINKYTKQG